MNEKPSKLEESSTLPYSSLRCLECGYNLDGLSQPTCPECGWVFDETYLQGVQQPQKYHGIIPISKSAINAVAFLIICGLSFASLVFLPPLVAFTVGMILFCSFAGWIVWDFAFNG